MTIEQLLSIVLPEFEEMSEEERLKFLNAIREKYCIHCGRFHGDSILPCRCWDDD
ncbi:MAG: hypothetical protein ACWGQW_13280 [bacterium]